MLVRKTLSVLFVLLISAGIAAADLKVIKQTHQDGFTIMGQTQPAEDTTKTYHVLDLPVDLSTLVPPEMQPMLAMMQFEVTVTPTDEHKQVGEWDARRYDMSMTSQMFSMKSTMWVTKVAGYDPEAFNSMYVHLNSLQPGMADAVKEMGKIDGLVVEQQGLITMMGNEVGTSEKTISIDNMDAPAGTYDPPAGYTEKPFDFMARMQR